jgi:hypothetical protein
MDIKAQPKCMLFIKDNLKEKGIDSLKAKNIC